LVHSLGGYIAVGTQCEPKVYSEEGLCTFLAVTKSQAILPIGPNHPPLDEFAKQVNQSGIKFESPIDLVSAHFKIIT